MRICTQQHRSGCMVACIAMVTGLPYITLVRRFFKNKESQLENTGVLISDAIVILHQLRYYTRLTSAIPLKTGRGAARGCGQYILCVPSLNVPGGSHAIVYDGATHRVLDPQQYYNQQAGRQSEPFQKVYTLAKLRTAKLTRCIVVCNLSSVPQTSKQTSK